MITYLDFEFEKGKLYKPGYHKDIDAISISPTGAPGALVEAQDLRIILPPIDEDTFIERSKKPLEQYWERPTPNNKIRPESGDRFREEILLEFKKRKEGLWFMNKGVPEYITGPHWNHMTNVKTGADDGGYYYFEKAQQELFIVMEAVWYDKRSMGLVFGKIRRYGATDCIMSFLLTKAIGIKDKNFGMTSKKDKDAKKNFRRLVAMFKGLPFYFKPKTIKETPRGNILEFRDPSLSTVRGTVNIEAQELNTEFSYLSTSEDSYDGYELKGYAADEISKWKRVNGNPKTHWDIVKLALKKGFNIVGKAFIFSTVENFTGASPDDDDAEAGDGFKWLWDNSDQNNRNILGRTQTGMYRVFQSVYDHYEGCIDRWGYVVIDDPSIPIPAPGNAPDVTIGVKTIIDIELKDIKDNPKALNSFLRKNPRKISDMFRTTNDSGLFNTIHIQDQIDFEDSLKEKRYTRYKLDWEDNTPMTNVIPVEDPHGRFYFKFLPPREYWNNVNIGINGRLEPGNTWMGRLGVDPYKVSQTTDGRGSKGAISGCTLPNTYEIEGWQIFVEYAERPDTKYIFFEDVIKLMYFLGMPALIENNVPELLDILNDRGMSEFSLRRPDKPIDKLTVDERMLGGIPSNSEKIKQLHASGIEWYIDKFVGIDSDGMIQSNCTFDRTLYQWMGFDINKRTKFDLGIASGYAIMACSSAIKMLAKQQGLQHRTVPIYTSYSNRGVRRGPGRRIKNQRRKIDTK